MKETLSYPVRIITGTYNGILTITTQYCQSVITTILHILTIEEQTIITNPNYTNTSTRMTALEKLIHKTKTNPNPKYPEFDQMYYKLPSYIRRNTERTAIGIYKAWHTQHEQWIENGRKGKEPILKYKHNASLVFYNKNAFLNHSKKGKNYIQLKLWNGKEWTWTDIPLRPTDIAYLEALSRDAEINSAPVLIRRGHKWELRFECIINIDLTDETKDYEHNKMRVCAIDLGVNTDATCCIMETDGTIVSRRFINCGTDKDRLFNKFKQVKKAQSHGARKLKKLYRRVNRQNDQLVNDIVKAIVEYAISYNCDVIACEFLNFNDGKAHRKKRHYKNGWRVGLWRARDIYHHLCVRAHKAGLHVHQVCAWQTSRLAFDGSGVVSRGRHILDEDGKSLGLPYAIVRFSSGKFYNADLNAAYNIGARFIVRFLLDYIEEVFGSDAREDILAKVPGCSVRSRLVLADLIGLVAAMHDLV